MTDEESLNEIDDVIIGLAEIIAGVRCNEREVTLS